MTDRIDFGGKPWAAIPRETLRDSALSPRAKGGLVTLLSHEEGWVRSVTAILMAENNCGRNQARSILHELVEAGYAEFEQSKGAGGRWTTAYTVRPVSTGKREGTYRLPVTRTPGAEPRGAVTGPVVVEAPDVDPLDVETQTTELELVPSFENWYKAYPRHQGRAPAEKAYAKALKKADWTVLLHAVIRYRGDPNRDAGFTKLPATWLNQECWNDDPQPKRQVSRRHEDRAAEIAREAQREAL